MKKAQGLSLNTIIIAALVIMVLVILILVFTERMGNFSSQSESCQAKGGTCKEECNPETEMESVLGGSCASEDQVCCVAKIV
jgi:Na+-transporting methylmalonyl-CoA/oxaloacetate decarboxylase gamma subunit